MKKRIVISTIVCLLICLCGGAFAAQTPESISAPQIYTYFTDDRGAGYIGMESALPDALWSVMREWNADPAAYKAAYGVDQLTLHMQYDWSVDSASDWHYAPDWDNTDGAGFVSGPLCAPCSTMDLFSRGDVVVFTDEDKQALFKNFLTEQNTFDYDAHTLYLRARYVLILVDFDAPEYSGYRYLTSAWSDARAFSPQAQVEVLPSVAAPEVSALTFDPQAKTLTFEVDVSDELIRTATRLLALTGRNFSLIAQVRTNGGSWTDADISDAAVPIFRGQRTVTLPAAIETENLYAEFRMRYVFTADGTGGIDRNVKTPWSQTSSYGVNTYYTAVDMNITPIGTATCGLCHNCSAPLGICLYIWLGVILAACIVLYIVIIVREKRRTRVQE